MGMQVLAPEAFGAAFPELQKLLPEYVLGPSVHVYDDDVIIDGHMNLSDPREDGKRGASVYLRSLTVQGDIINYDGDSGRTLVVKGKLTTHNLVGGGAVIRLGDVVVDGVVLGHYNHGSLHGDSLKALMLISEDHDTWFLKKDVDISFNGFGGMESVYIDGEHMDALRSDWQDQLVMAFFYGPMADFFKDTPWFGFWADTKGTWTEYEGAAPSDYPDLEAEDATMDWFRWINGELKSKTKPVPDSFQAFVDLAKKHIVPPNEGDNDHASG